MTCESLDGGGLSAGRGGGGSWAEVVVKSPAANATNAIVDAVFRPREETHIPRAEHGRPAIGSDWKEDFRRHC